MMSLEVIKELAREHAILAAATDQKPYVYFNAEEVDEHDGFPFPFLGDYIPEGWVLIDTHFCDASGFGQDDEPALSARQFRRIILDRIAENSGTGWAITEAGQFQVYVGEYRRVS